MYYWKEITGLEGWCQKNQLVWQRESSGVDSYIFVSLCFSIFLLWSFLQDVLLEGNHLPDLSTDAKGANWFDVENQMMWVIVGGEPVDIITSPLIVVSTFFNPDLIANNFALFFGIPPWCSESGEFCQRNQEEKTGRNMGCMFMQ